MIFLIIVTVNVGLCYCDIVNSNNTNLERKILEVEGQLNNGQRKNLFRANVDLHSSIDKEKTIINKSNKNEVKKVTKKVTLIKKNTKQQKKKMKGQGSSENKVKTIKKTRKKTKSISSESKSTSESNDEDSEERRYQLGEGETLLDFSALAKIKTLDNIDQDSQDLSQINEMFTKDNPLLNWNCSSLSLEEEQNISTGYLDKRISHVITHAENFPDGGTQLLDDMRHYYCYLKHVNQLVTDNVRRGRILMKQLVEEDPEFTQIGFDTNELAEHFSWIKEETEAFEYFMDSICYQWKCLVARLKHK